MMAETSSSFDIKHMAGELIAGAFLWWLAFRGGWWKMFAAFERLSG